MKPFVLSLLITLLTISTNAQLTVRLLDAETEKPIPSNYITVAENGKGVYKLHGRSDSNGYFSLKPFYIASRATYHLQLNNLKYEHVWHKIDLKRRDTAIIKIKKNPYYIAEDSNLYSTKCDGYMLDHDLLKSTRSLSYLPEHIQATINGYLIDRVGKSQLENFTLIDGEMIDYQFEGKEYYIENDKPIYYLCFAYRNLDAGIAMYSSNLLLGADGKILKDLDFPVATEGKSDLNFIPFSEIIKIANERSIYIPEHYRESNGASHYKTEVSMNFSKEDNILTWDFLNQTYYEDGTCDHTTYIFNAQDGNFLRKNEMVKCTYIDD